MKDGSEKGGLIVIRVAPACSYGSLCNMTLLKPGDIEYHKVSFLVVQPQPRMFGLTRFVYTCLSPSPKDSSSKCLVKKPRLWQDEWQ